MTQVAVATNSPESVATREHPGRFSAQFGMIL